MGIMESGSGAGEAVVGVLVTNEGGGGGGGDVIEVWDEFNFVE